MGLRRERERERFINSDGASKHVDVKQCILTIVHWVLEKLMGLKRGTVLLDSRGKTKRASLSSRCIASESCVLKSLIFFI